MKSGEKPEQRGLACAIGSCDAYYIAGFDRQVNVVQDHRTRGHEPDIDESDQRGRRHTAECTALPFRGMRACIASGSGARIAGFLSSSATVLQVSGRNEVGTRKV